MWNGFLCYRYIICFTLLQASKWTDRFQVLNEEHSKEKGQVRQLATHPATLSPCGECNPGTLKHTHAHTYTHTTHAYTYAHTRTQTHKCTHACTHTHMWPHTRIHTHSHANTQAQAQTHVRTHRDTHICVHTRDHTTHAHMHKLVIFEKFLVYLIIKVVFSYLTFLEKDVTKL